MTLAVIKVRGFATSVKTWPKRPVTGLAGHIASAGSKLVKLLYSPVASRMQFGLYMN